METLTPCLGSAIPVSVAIDGLGFGLESGRVIYLIMAPASVARPATLD